MNEPTCRICLDRLGQGDSSAYHEGCCRDLFNSPGPPVLPYSWDDLNALAEKVVRRHVTVPGVQPKLSLHLERARQPSGRLTLVGMEGEYILKPPTTDYPEMPELEHLTMQMARACGIETCPCGLISLEDGRWALIARRMDRIDGRKRHMEDMCQLTDRLTERKYSGSLEQVGKAILRFCDNALFDALRFFELNVFCFLTGNADMHRKNFSLIYDAGGEIRLAPAYDLVPTALLLPEDKEETALTLNGRKRRLKRKDFQALGLSLRLTEKQLANSMARLKAGIGRALRLLDDGFCLPETRRRYTDLILHRCVRAEMGDVFAGGSV